MSITAIRAALETRLGTMSPALSTAYQNVAFMPVTGTAYQAVYLLPATVENPTLGDGFYRERGLMQVSLMYPMNAGPATAEARASAIKAHFPRGLQLTSGSVTTRIDRTPSISPPRPDGDRWRVDVSIPYFADIFP